MLCGYSKIFYSVSFFFCLLIGVFIISAPAKAAFYSNGTQISGLWASSSAAVAINSITINKICRQYSGTTGNVWLEIHQTSDPDSLILATSTIDSVSEFLYQSNPNNCPDASGHNFEFAAPFTMATSTDYYFLINRDSNSIYFDDPSGYDGNTCVEYCLTLHDSCSLSCSTSLKAQASFDYNEEIIDVTIIELPSSENVGVDIVDPELYQNECRYQPCAKFDTEQYCIIDNPVDCIFDFEYNDIATPATVYLIPDGGDIFPDEAVSSTTLTSTIGGWNHSLVIPKAATSTTTLYWLWFDIPDYGNYRFGKGLVEFVYDWEIATQTEGGPIWQAREISKCGAEKICTEVATSSGSTFDDFRYGFECGLKKVICWMVYPTKYGDELLAETNEKIKQQFPVSIGTQIWTVFDDAASSSLSTSTDISVPLKWYNKNTGQYEETGSYLLSSSTFQTGMGSDLFDFYYDWTGNFIKIAGFLYLLWMIFGIVTPRKTSITLKKNDTVKYDS